MNYAKAVDVVKDNSGKTIGYILESESGERVELASNKIKELIQNKSIYCVNLIITSNNRLLHMKKYDKLGYNVSSDKFFRGTYGDWRAMPTGGELLMLSNEKTHTLYDLKCEDAGTKYILSYRDRQLGTVSKLSRQSVDGGIQGLFEKLAGLSSMQFSKKHDSSKYDYNTRIDKGELTQAEARQLFILRKNKAAYEIDITVSGIDIGRKEQAGRSLDRLKELEQKARGYSDQELQEIAFGTK